MENVILVTLNFIANNMYHVMSIILILLLVLVETSIRNLNTFEECWTTSCGELFFPIKGLSRQHRLLKFTLFVQMVALVCMSVVAFVLGWRYFHP